jgi:hypothetical protein
MRSRPQKLRRSLVATKSPRFRIVLAAVIGVAALALVPGALAGKGGKPAGGGSTSTATLVSDCNPCAVGSYAHFTGSGYDGSQSGVQVNISGTGMAFPINADGTLSFTVYMSPAGTYDVKVYQWGSGHKLVLKAELSNLVVQ